MDSNGPQALASCHQPLSAATFTPRPQLPLMITPEQYEPVEGSVFVEYGGILVGAVPVIVNVYNNIYIYMDI